MLKLKFLIIVLLLASCSSNKVYTPVEIQQQADALIQQAQSKIAKGEHEEALILVAAVQKLDDEYPGLDEISTQLMGVENLLEPSLMGFNYSRRVKTERSWPAKIALYPVDRFGDLLDVFSAQAYLGIMAYVNVWGTHALDAGGGISTGVGLGLLDGGSIGFESRAETGMSFLFFGASAIGGARAGSHGVDTTATAHAGLNSPKLAVYQEFRDYWGMGFDLGLAVLGIRAEIHPLQILDFMTGLVGIDICNDDLAKTRSLNFTDRDVDLLEQWAEILISEPSVLAYQNHRQSTDSKKVSAAE